MTTILLLLTDVNYGKYQKLLLMLHVCVSQTWSHNTHTCDVDETRVLQYKLNCTGADAISS